jgi:hypothetical protein
VSLSKLLILTSHCDVNNSLKLIYQLDPKRASVFHSPQAHGKVLLYKEVTRALSHCLLVSVKQPLALACLGYYARNGTDKLNSSCYDFDL